MTSSIHTLNAREINAAPDRVYALAADVAAWPRILPHYRYVRILVADGLRRTVAMGAHRSGIPVRWTAVQELHPERLEIVYRHVGGVTRGMDVVWRIVPAGEVTRATISHDLSPDRWWLQPTVSRYIVGSLFVAAIADRTLAGIARCAEGRGSG